VDCTYPIGHDNEAKAHVGRPVKPRHQRQTGWRGDDDLGMRYRLHMCALALKAMAGGPGPNWFSVFQIFSSKQNYSDLENTKSILLELQNCPNFARWKVTSKGTTLLWERISNSKWILK
jgi:hypothetical protein